MSISTYIWKLWCVSSVIGIWPEFIEPFLISTTKKSISLAGLPDELKGLKILHFSDLHITPKMPDFFLKKLSRKIKKLKPDLVVFTGDFTCYSQVSDPVRLEKLLTSIHAPYGCYAVLGNHDYDSYISVNKSGLYDVMKPPKSSLKRGLGKVFSSPITLIKQATDKIKKVTFNSDLMQLVAKTPFRILHNETVQISINGTVLNLTGLGDHMAGKCDPASAFKSYDAAYQGIVLSHNSDSIYGLQEYPGELVLSGHTHGGQINIPYLRERFMLTENMHLRKGLHHIGKKLLHISKGLGSGLSFRWFAMPEITLLTLK